MRVWVYAGIAMLCACTPDFTYRDEDEDGTGGSSTETGSGSTISSTETTTGTAPTETGTPTHTGTESETMTPTMTASMTDTPTMTMTDTGMEPPVVTCDQPVTTCAAGQVCCFDSGGTDDYCSSSGCGSDYTMACDGDNDCPTGYTCCASFDPGWLAVGQYIMDGTACDQACNAFNEEPICASSADCGGGPCTTYWNNYKFCE